MRCLGGSAISTCGVRGPVIMKPTCACMSITPGTIVPPGHSTTWAAPACRSGGPAATILPPSTITAVSRTGSAPVPSMSRCRR